MRVAIFFLLSLAFSTNFVMAQETESFDNRCQPGGIWDDGRCAEGTLDEQNWHWMCGWYMAQIDNGNLSEVGVKANVPLCVSLFLPQFRELSDQTRICMVAPFIDSDCDGLYDLWEMARFGHLSQTATDDPDRDGCDNLCEQTNGTAPI